MTCTLNQRADGYVASDLFFFGINTAVRLGVAAAPGLNLTNPLTGVALTEAGAASAGTMVAGGDITADQYLYLVSQGTGDAAYTAGRFMIEIIGYDVAS